MRAGGHKRQVFLFITAILLPAAEVIVLGARIICQERELAGKRTADERRNAIEQLRRELAARLEAIKLDEINRLIRAPEQRWAEGPGNPAVTFVAKIEADRLILPWEAVSQTATPVSAPFARHRQEGERQEFAQKELSRGSRSVSASAGLRASSLRARRSPAAFGASAGQSRKYRRSIRRLPNAAQRGGAARDEEGVGFRFYAAERLLDAKQEPDAVRRFLVEQVNSGRWLTLPEMYLIRSLLGSIPGQQTDPARDNVSARIAQMEQAVALAKDFARVRARIESGAPAGAVWIPYGSEPGSSRLPRRRRLCPRWRLPCPPSRPRRPA